MGTFQRRLRREGPPLGYDEPSFGPDGKSSQFENQWPLPAHLPVQLVSASILLLLLLPLPSLLMNSSFFSLPMWTEGKQLPGDTQAFSIQSGLLRHPASWTEQFPGSQSLQCADGYCQATQHLSCKTLTDFPWNINLFYVFSSFREPQVMYPPRDCKHLFATMYNGNFVPASDVFLRYSECNRKLKLKEWKRP